MKDNTIKVILVDDEYLVREKLKMSIDWNGLGMCIVAEAGSAFEAIELVDELVPEIIFVDICMPFMDGMQFSETITEKYPQIKIIILTGHEKFEYAQRSIKIGIEDFICKPISKKEIFDVLLRVKEKIEHERYIKNEYNEDKNRLEENLPFLKERYLNELMNGHISAEDTQKKNTYYKLQLKQGFFQVALIELWTDSNEFSTEENCLVLGIKGLDMVKRYLSQYDGFFIFMDNGGRIAILSNNSSINLQDYCEIIKNLLLNCLDCYVCIGIGNYQTEMLSISNSYKEAYNATEYKVVEGKNQVICYNDINISADNSITVTGDEMDKLAFYIRAGMMDQAIEIVSCLLDYRNSNTARVSKESVRVISASIVSTILVVVISMGINPDKIFASERNPYDYVFKADTIPEIKKYLLEIVVKIVNLIGNVKTNEASHQIEKIEKYITENIGKSDLSLNGVAEVFYLNSSYLSRKFKQETGCTFSEYVCKLRMSLALNLIKETDLKVYQVAEKIGIPDPHYFSICFKKNNNISISDYRRALNKD